MGLTSYQICQTYDCSEKNYFLGEKNLVFSPNCHLAIMVTVKHVKLLSENIRTAQNYFFVTFLTSNSSLNGDPAQVPFLR